MKNGSVKIKRNLVGFIKQAFLKLVVFPLKYGRKNDYDAARYWEDRLRKYNLNIKAVGIEGLSEKENLRHREQTKQLFITICRNEIKTFDSIAVMEIGCGTAFYANILKDMGLKNYTGVDITDALFPELRKQFPDYRFIKKDASMEPLEGRFDFIIMMDVIQHIVNKEKLEFVLSSVKQCLGSNGIFLLVPVTEQSQRHLFHVHRWGSEDIESHFQKEFEIQKKLARNDEYLLVIKKIKQIK